MNELDILYIVLAVGFASLAIFGSIALYRLSKVLGDIEKTVVKVNRTADAVEGAVERVVPIVNGFTGAINILIGLVQKWTSGSEKPLKSKSK